MTRPGNETTATMRQMRQNLARPADRGRCAAGRLSARRRAGMTLAEVSISLGVVATIMVAIGSIMVLTGKAVAVTATNASEARVDDIVTTFMGDQRLALTVTERTATSIAFTIADRTGDGVPEMIRYAWSGVAGDPLTRQVNGATPVVIARDVKRFGLSYITKNSIPAAPVEQESAEEVFYDQGAGTSLATVSSSSTQAQFFATKFSRPTADVTSWRIKSVRLKASRPSGSTGSWKVGVYKDAGGKPALLPEFAQDFPLTGLAAVPKDVTLTFSKTDQNLDPQAKYWIVIQPVTGVPSPSVSYSGTNTTAGDSGQMLTATLSIWGGAIPYRDLNITVKGTYKYVAP
jgi:hypothetical protein